MLLRLVSVKSLRRHLLWAAVLWLASACDINPQPTLPDNLNPQPSFGGKNATSGGPTGSANGGSAGTTPPDLDLSDSAGATNEDSSSAGGKATTPNEAGGAGGEADAGGAAGQNALSTGGRH